MCGSNEQKAKVQGFTLVELSIVILIIGLLIAGVATGTSLVKQAEINSVITDMKDYQTAYNQFSLRYAAIPGDMKNAAGYWPAGTAQGCALTDDTECMGNGNGIIEESSPGVPNEALAAWRELSLAGMINAGVAPVGSTGGAAVLGVSVPVSKVLGAGYIMVGGGQSMGSITSIFDTGTNAVHLATIDSISGNLDDSALSSEDAFNIDKKIDDGSYYNGAFVGAFTGNFRSTNGVGIYADCINNGNLNQYTMEKRVVCVGGMVLD